MMITWIKSSIRITLVTILQHSSIMMTIIRMGINEFQSMLIFRQTIYLTIKLEFIEFAHSMWNKTSLLDN